MAKLNAGLGGLAIPGLGIAGLGNTRPCMAVLGMGWAGLGWPCLAQPIPSPAMLSLRIFYQILYIIVVKK